MREKHSRAAVSSHHLPEGRGRSIEAPADWLKFHDPILWAVNGILG
jgi:hypothetical protein